MATVELWTTAGLMDEGIGTSSSSASAAASSGSSPASATTTESGAVSLRRRRMELRRIKMMTSSAATYLEQPVSKRLRPVSSILRGDGLDGCYGGLQRCSDEGVRGSELPAARLQQDAGKPDAGWRSGGDGVLCDGDECDTVGDQSSDRMMQQRSESSDMGSSVTFATEFHGTLGTEVTPAVTGASGAAAVAGAQESSAAAEVQSAGAAAAEVQSAGAAAAEVQSAGAAAAEVQSAGAAAAAAPAGTEEMAATEETVTEVAQFGDGSFRREESSVNENSVAAAAVVAVDASGSAGAVGDCFASNACPSHGMVSLCGRRREMEDAVVSKDSFVMLPCNQVGGCDASGLEAAPLHYFGVYDGHGGSQAANFCAERLHQALAEEVESCFVQGQNVEQSWESKWLSAMTQCFKRMDAEVGGFCLVDSECQSGENSRCCPEPIAPETVGTTAVVAVVGACQIIIGNCGDSRAVLSRGGVAVPLSVDHKPEREDEMARVEAAGGRVIYWNGYRVLGVLAMSRAIGDRYLKPYVIPEPEVKCIKRADDDECLILASDGLWDVMSNEVVCDIARRALNCRRNGQPPDPALGSTSDEDSPAAQAAALLVNLALAKGSSDNISVVVVDLKVNR